jgi:hypothetical protein
MTTLNQILLLTVAIFIVCCNSESSDKENTNAFKSVNQDSIKKSSDCFCFDGIGSKSSDLPIINFEFANGKKIVVCGFVDKEMEGVTVSEFNVFDCLTGKSLTEYDATQVCRLVENNDTLQISEYKYLPILKNHEWELIKISEQFITTKENEIVVSKLKPKVESFQIDKTTAENFLMTLEKGKGIGENWEKEIGFLEALSIMGNNKAWNILKKYESFTGQETDGAIAETWKDAIATVEWIKMNK